MTERTLATEGQRPHRVRVYTCATRLGTRLVRVEWREESRRMREARPDTKDNRTWAKGLARVIAARLVLGQQRTARGRHHPMREVVDAYLLANTPQWRSKTALGARNKLGVWLAFTGDTMPLESVTPELVDQYRHALRTTPRTKTGRPMAPHQVSRHANEVKALLRFARSRKLIDENPLAEYTVKLGKDERQLDVGEYTNEEWGAILAQLSPRKALEWRPYCLIVLGGILGARQTALRSLEWADVDWGERLVTWRADTDKVGRERTQPLPRAGVRVLRIALVWRTRDGYDGPWIFYSSQRRTRELQPYTYQALNYQLHQAERRAGVTPRPYRAMHGLRRTAAGNALEATNNVKTAGQWIGDTDPKSLNRYLKRRDRVLEQLAATTTLPHQNGTRTATQRQTTETRTAPKRRKGV